MKKAFVAAMTLASALLIVLLTSCAKNDAQKDTDTEFKRIALVSVAVYADVIGEKFPNASIEYCNTVSDAILKVETEKVDAYIEDGPVLKKAIAGGSNLKLLTPSIHTVEYGVAVNKNNTRLVQQLNEFIAQIKSDGTYDEMRARWTDEDATLIMPDIPEGENGALIFATTGEVNGFSFFKDGELMGFDVELAKRFAAYMDMRLDTRVMNFAALVPAINSGKVDFAVSVVAITEERREMVAFSDPYFSLESYLCVLGDEEAAASTGFFTSIKESFVRNLIAESRWKMIAQGLKVTLIIACLSFILGNLLGVMVCHALGHESALMRSIGRGYVIFLSSTPIVVLLMVIYYVVFAKIAMNTILVAVIAYALNASATIGTLFQSSISAVDKGQIEAARSMGFDRRGAFMTIILPQAINKGLRAYKSELSSLIKSTSVVGYIAVVDLTKAVDIIRGRTYDSFFPLLLVTLVYLVLTGVIVLLFNAINRLLDKSMRRSVGA